MTLLSRTIRYPHDVSMAPSPEIVAGLDIGTLTCRLLIAKLSPVGNLIELKSDRRILRLGQGVDQDRMLRADAMECVIMTLKEWRHVIEECHADAITAVATSAVRDAGNREEFLNRIKREVGFEVEVITGEEEARRTILGIRSGLPPGVADVLALDIGGGSTEFILDRQGKPPMVRSTDVGVVRLSERILRHEPPTLDEISQARDWVRKATARAAWEMLGHAAITLVGTAGTITSLAAMAQQLPAYEPARIHNHTLTLETVKKLEHQLLGRRKDQRRGMPGLEPGREEVIAAGTLILTTIMELFGYHELLVSDLGLREGVLIDLARKLKKAESDSNRQ
jgi:exopolyphosphatase/guanosine-5'-triphosphate,3'-diphosphate pyrophosphatase